MNRIFAVAGQKYEPDWLVDDMKANLSWVDEVCMVDTRHRTHELWIDEGEYRLLQRKALQDAGIERGDWVYVTSPDERLEKTAGDQLRIITSETKRPTILKFQLKEMFTPTAYRTDGIWNRKTRPRMYMYLPHQTFSTKRIQQSPIPVNGRYDRKLLDIRIYHLKNIEPASRDGRVQAYKLTDPNYTMINKNSRSMNRIDPEGKFQRMGYDYLKDLDGMTLQEIEKGREFTPEYIKPYIFEIPKSFQTN